MLDPEKPNRRIFESLRQLSPSFAPKEALEQIAWMIAGARDIIDGRVADDQVPAWCETRGWTRFLLSIDDEELMRCESEGLAVRLRCMAEVPASLEELGEDVRKATTLAELGVAHTDDEPMKSVSVRKQAQLSEWLALCDPLIAASTRVVDVGTGRGHLARRVASRYEKPAIGIERDSQRVREADRLSQSSGAQYRVADASRQDMGLGAGDLAIGLHACGELADILIRSAAGAGCRVALVSCCPQKITGEARSPLSCCGERMGLVLPRETLGLANLLSREQGVEESTAQTLQARHARAALRALLRCRGVDLGPGEEMRGINRRRAGQGLLQMAAMALSIRKMEAATRPEIAQSEKLAAEQFPVVRRLSLARNMLGRLLEVAIVLDRACYLWERGYSVQVGTVFPVSVTPRNIGLLASPPTALLT
jgi:hypothetical protein